MRGKKKKKKKKKGKTEPWEKGVKSVRFVLK
jgi:hypothetical protein